MITAGESHGPGLTCIIEGLPAGLELDREALDRDLARRQLGHGRGGRMKIERDQAEVTGRRAARADARRPDRAAGRQPRLRQLGGADEPVAGGGRASPRSTCPRPGHADLVGTQKYGLTDVRDILERASARETAARVAGGAVAKAFLRALGVEVFSHVIQITGVSAAAPRRPDARGLRRASTSRRSAAWIPRRARRWSPRSTVCARRTSRSAACSRCGRSGSCPGSDRTSPGRSGSTAGSPGDPLDPGDQGRLDRRRLRGRRRARLAGARRDLLRRGARLLPRDATAPAGSRAA